MTTAPAPKDYLLRISPYKAGKTARDPSVTPIKLSSNENPYGASPAAITAFKLSAASLHRYPDGSCYDLRHCLAQTHGLNADNIVCGAGSDELIGLLVHAYAGPGDEVLFTEHAFLMYRIYTLAAGATPVEAKETRLITDVDALLASVTERTKIVFVANPNNPTGTYISDIELTRLRRGLPDHVILAVDGAYAECCDAPDYTNGQSLAMQTHNTVMLRTFSKIYGLPALRLGWMVGCAEIIDVINRVKSPFNVTAPAQRAGVAALQDSDWLEEQRLRNSEGRHTIADGCAALGFTPVPTQTNFVLIDTGSTTTAHYLIHELEARHIYVRDVSSYKLPHCVRISVGTQDENNALLNALKQLHTG